ncbi:cell division control protein 48 homolog C-like [Telopea speciosissima]|uniref:cell division control protein 48 homolog C-like n=1 Tax=Telopea speciosissima TaxID=54955 RepID=UPI001CC41258|nr:cell division control protein 48 homolog C-like [Telopea speciosissima]
MRRRMGGGSPSVFNRNMLLRRLESCRHKSSSVENIVEYLRSTFPDYRRIKQQPFSKYVQQTLEFQQRRQNFSTFTEETDSRASSPTPARKKLKRIKQREQDRPLTSSVASSSSSGNDDESDGAVSISEGAVYEEKVEPEFDLMKSMLRSSYSASKNIDTKVKAEEKNLEMEVINKEKKIGLIGRDGIETLGVRKELSSRDGYEVKGKDKPRFRDLGGIKGVLDELMVEVLFPLYYPQLPSWLGVRPITGILLHGPPGCGKTQLVHAIANETGMPFYKISATEVVSGVSGT